MGSSVMVVTSRTAGFSDRERLLLAAISDRFSLDGVALDGIADTELAGLASRNRVAPFLWRLAGRSAVKSRLSEHARSQARAAMADTSLLGLKLAREIRRVGEILGAAGARAMLYKGPDIAERCYERSCPRLFGDLDLLFRDRDVDTAITALQAAGYAQDPVHGPPPSYYRRFHLHGTYHRPGTVLPVEAHWALESPYADRPNVLPALFAQAEEAEGFGPAFVRPSLLDGFILMALHAEKHLVLSAPLPTATARLKAVIEGGGLLWLLDLVRWLERFGAGVDGRAVDERSAELGAGSAMVIAMHMAQDLNPEALPEWAREHAQRMPPSHAASQPFVVPPIGERSRARSGSPAPSHVAVESLAGPRVPASTAAADPDAGSTNSRGRATVRARNLRASSLSASAGPRQWPRTREMEDSWGVYLFGRLLGALAQ